MPFTLLQLALFAAFAAALALTARRARQGVISRAETFVWCAFWLAAAVIVARPEFASRAAEILGVGRGVDVVVYAAIVALFFLIFRLYVRIDTLERDITVIVRRDTLNRHD